MEISSMRMGSASVTSNSGIPVTSEVARFRVPKDYAPHYVSNTIYRSYHSAYLMGQKLMMMMMMMMMMIIDI
jgi:hypothetical protein